jgi:glycosyltransferase involved in cell wall biosynthesis
MNVSILLPAWNAEATLPACLASIVRQTERRWECVIVDDGSTDGTGGVARAFASRDARFRLVTTPHRGLVAALETGLGHCEAPLVARMDADDVMHRERLARQVAALADDRLAAVGAHVRFFPRRGLTDGGRGYEEWLNAIDSPERVRAEAFVECPVVHPTLMIRREVLAAFGYRDTDWPEDYDLVLRLLATGQNVSVVPRRLLGWRDGPARLTRTAPRYALERIAACKAAFLASGFLAGVEEYVLWGYGSTGRAIRRALLVHGKRPSHIVEVDPRRLGQKIDGAPVVPYEALASLGRRSIVASVAGGRARGAIRAALLEMGFSETRDFVCAA